MLRFLWRTFLFLLGIVIGLVLVYQAWTFVQVWWYVDHDPKSTAFMDDRLAKLRAADPAAKLRHSWVPYGRISVHLKRAAIAAEDGKFLDHEGFDWEAIQRAYERNVKKGKVVAGGSTISQQLAKNLFLSGERNFLRKGQEAIVTWMLETMMDKRRILEIYLNVIEWGDGVFGAEAGARHYFGVPAAQLTPAQAARLAAMIPRPRYFDRNRNSPFLDRQGAVILKRMPSAQVP